MFLVPCLLRDYASSSLANVLPAVIALLPIPLAIRLGIREMLENRSGF